jgi:hypothetical protein
MTDSVAAPPANRRSPADVAAFAFLVMATGVYVLCAARVESHGSDTSTYFGLAQSLVRGDGYRFNFVPHTVYPPGYPVVLASLMVVVGESFATLLRVAVPVYFVGLACVYVLVRGERDPSAGLAVTILCGTSFAAFFWTTAGLHSDVLYFAVSAVALLCVDVAERAQGRRARLAAIVVGSACVAYLPMVRSIGVTFLAGLGLWMTLPLVVARLRDGSGAAGRIRRWAPAAVATVVVLGSWMSWSSRQESYAGDGHMASYAQQLLKADPHEIDAPAISPLRLPARAGDLLLVRVRRTTQMVLNQPYRDFSWTNPAALVFLLGVLGAIGSGFARSLVTRATLTDCYVLAYGALLLLWPFDEGQRFLFPIQPFLILYGIEGLRAIGGAVASRGPWRQAAPRLMRVGGGMLFVAMVAMGVLPSIEFARRAMGETPAVPTNAPTLAAVDWIRVNTRPDEVIMVDEAAILHRLTERRTYRFPLLTDPERIAELLDATGTDYVLVLREQGPAYFRPGTEARFETARARAPDRFIPVYDYSDGVIYQVIG